MTENDNSILDLPIPAKPNTKNSILFGLIVIAIFVGGFTLWAIIAPLESAAMAPGQIIVSGYRRTIQHLEGGIVKAIYVKDGMNVKKDQMLLKLDDEQAKISLDLKRNDVLEFLGADARLQAEKNNADKITFSPRLSAESKDKKTQEVIQGQIDIFNADQKAFNGSVFILKQKISQLNEEIKGTQASIEATMTQLKLINEEVVSVTELEKQRLVERSRLLSLQREEARLSGVIAESKAKIATLEQSIGEAELRITALEKDRKKEVLNSLRETQQKLSEALEKEKAADEILFRTEIRSPISGVVVGLKIHTLGGVIKPGDPIMDVVPSHEQLVVEAKINPNDIDIVHKGLPAKVQLTAYKMRTTPILQGVVTEVSADVFNEKELRESYYLARVVINQDELSRLPKNIRLYPGMPVEVMIISAKLTPWQYFISPITQSFNRAFREQ